MRKRAQRSDQERDGHGSRHALAADVADSNQDAAVGDGDDLEEVTPDLTGGLVDAGQRKAGNGGDIVGHQDLLHGARGFDLSLVALFIAAGADEAEQQNSEERKLNDDPGGLIRSQREGPVGEGDEQLHVTAPPAYAQRQQGEYCVDGGEIQEVDSDRQRKDPHLHLAFLRGLEEQAAVQSSEKELHDCLSDAEPERADPIESEKNVDRRVKQGDRDGCPVKTGSSGPSKVPDQDRHGPIEPGKQDGPAQFPKNDVEGMEIAPDRQEDIENVEGLPHAEPEKFAVGRAQQEEHQGAEAGQQANKTIYIEFCVDPKQLAPSQCLPLSDEAGIAQ